jgi:hypothetical protein
MIYQLLDDNNEEVSSGTFDEMKELEQQKREFGESGFTVCLDYFAMGYAFYKSDDKNSESAINKEFMLGFLMGLAEYPDYRFKTIKQAFEHYFGRFIVDTFVDLAVRLKANKTEFQRWPALPIT